MNTNFPDASVLIRRRSEKFLSKCWELLTESRLNGNNSYLYLQDVSEIGGNI
jgi:hypothetical protein